jgi:hypothetical protein
MVLIRKSKRNMKEYGLNFSFVKLIVIPCKDTASMKSKRIKRIVH